MKLNYLFLFIIFVLAGFSSKTHSQIRFLEVDKNNEEITLKNFGSNAENLSDWWFCSLFNYEQLSSLTIENGDLMLMPDQTVTLSGYTLVNTEADLGLYENGSFSSANDMRDFLQWGSAGNGRENVADAAGIWNAGDFLPDANTYQYAGDGSQTGVGFWNTLSLNNVENRISVDITPNPVDQILQIKQQNVQPLEVQVYNLTGQLAKRSFINKQNATLDFSTLNSGIYFIKLIDANQNTDVQKIIKK